MQSKHFSNSSPELLSGIAQLSLAWKGLKKQMSSRCFPYVKFRITEAERAVLTYLRPSSKSLQQSSQISDSGSFFLPSCQVHSLSCAVCYPHEFWKIKIFEPYHTHTHTQSSEKNLLPSITAAWVDPTAAAFSDTSVAMGSWETFNFSLYQVFLIRPGLIETPKLTMCNFIKAW